MGFPGGSAVKNSSADVGDVDLISELGTSPGGGNGTHSSILAWEIPQTEEPGELQPWGGKSRAGLSDWWQRATSVAGPPPRCLECSSDRLTAPCPSAHLNLAGHHWLSISKKTVSNQTQQLQTVPWLDLHMDSLSLDGKRSPTCRDGLRRLWRPAQANRSSPTWTHWVSPPTHPQGPQPMSHWTRVHTPLLLAMFPSTLHSPCGIRLQLKPPPWLKKNT